MKEILEAKLGLVINCLQEADYHHDVLNSSYYEGQKVLLEDLINQCVHIECSYDAHDYYSYDDEYCDYHNDVESRYYDDMEHYKQQEMDNMYDVHYHYSWWIGKNVMSIDSYWFTSDEIEAFRVIWQRRISAM
jgi:hypothetical protein